MCAVSSMMVAVIQEPKTSLVNAFQLCGDSTMCDSLVSRSDSVEMLKLM